MPDCHTGRVPVSRNASDRRVVPAPAAEVFELLATPARHPVVDGSGTVTDVQERTPERLSPGARFGMRMHWGLRYKILNEVVEFEEGRRIAWRHAGGHVWRWLLVPVDETSTLVIEEFDASTSRVPLLLLLIGAQRRNQRSIERSLDRLEAWARER
ncbi:SRPBCC family protein [Microlunatus capsulatus]